jgi:hypothetical protein
VDEAHVLAVVHAVDEPHLPQRAVTVEQLAHEPLGQPEEVAPRARRGQARQVHVVGDREALVVDPHRPAAAERHRHHPLAELGHELHPRGDQAAHVVEAEAPLGIEERGPLEDRDRADVHRRLDPFEVQEGLVDGAQTLVADPGSHARSVGVAGMDRQGCGGARPGSLRACPALPPASGASTPR